jgi:hypothetical protein
VGFATLFTIIKTKLSSLLYLPKFGIGKTPCLKYVTCILREAQLLITWFGDNRCTISVPIMLGSVVNDDPENSPCRQRIKPHNITK